MPQCVTCVFFRPTLDYEPGGLGREGRTRDWGNGECHRYPTPVRVAKGHWCGEHKQKEDA